MLAKGDPIPLDMLVHSKLVQQELTRPGIDSIALLNKTMNSVTYLTVKLKGMVINGWRPCSCGPSLNERRRDR